LNGHFETKAGLALLERWAFLRIRPYSGSEGDLVTNAVVSDFRSAIAMCIEEAQDSLASRWFEELKRVVPVAENEVFPGDGLLGQIPALVQEVAAVLMAPAEGAIAANAVLTARATELGQLRHAQHASVHQVLREYRLLRTVVAQFIKEESSRLQLEPTVDELIDLMDRFETVVDVLLQTTVETLVAEYTDTITKHTTRLEGFNRMVTHELRQPLGVFQFAVKLLGSDQTLSDRAKHDQVLATAERNVTRMNETLGKLVTLSRSEEGPQSALVQRLELETMANDVFGQLREMAEARGVDTRIVKPLPALTVDAARLEFVLVNLVSNAIKYSDPTKSVRFVEIAPAPSSRPDVCTLSIRDNGIGIAEADLRTIFARFYRGRPERDRELGTSGLGLGLSIVGDCVDALKGDIHVDSVLGEGTTFLVELPSTPQT
jgi:signal transduction histidine kinase